jgi:flagellar biogenesis protein FliO
VTQTKILTKQEPKTKKWNFDSYIAAIALILTLVYLVKRWIDKLTE